MNAKRLKLFILTLSVIIPLMSVLPMMPANAQDPLLQTQQKLQEISDDEKEVLNKLFDMTHDMEEIKSQEKKLTEDIETLNKQAESLKTAIAEQEKNYSKRLNVLKQVLQVYQRKGPGTYIGTILESESLKDFLYRLGTVQDLSRNTAELLDSLNESKAQLKLKKHGLDEKLKLMESKQKELKEALNGQLELKQKLESYLSSLNQQKTHYQEQLKNLEQVWNNLKLLFSDASGEFSHITESGNLPYDAVGISFTEEGIEGTLNENTINSMMSQNPILSQLKFSFHPNEAEIEVPEKSLILKGTFEIVNGSSLKFAPREGSFYGMALKEDTIKELFSNGELLLDFKPIMGNSSLKNFEILDGSLKFIIKLSL